MVIRVGFFLFISSQQLYIFITPINLLVAPPTSHMVWKIDFYQTYFNHPRSSQWWLNIDFIISWHHHWMLTGSTAQLTCTTKYIFFCYKRQSIHAPHLRIFIYQFCLRSLIQHWNLENPLVYKISDMEATIYFPIVASWSLNLFVYMLVYYISKQWWPKSWCKIPLYSRHEKIIYSTQTK